jgi:hypothetical protein
VQAQHGGCESGAGQLNSQPGASEHEVPDALLGRARVPARMTPSPGRRRRVRIDNIPYSSSDSVHSVPPGRADSTRTRYLQARS